MKKYETDWFDEEGYDIEWYDESWLDRDWYDRNWFNKEGIHLQTGTKYNPDGFTREQIW